MSFRASRALVALALAVALAAAARATAARGATQPLPREFFGIVPQGKLTQADYDRMRGVVRTLRIPIFWYQVEPRFGEYHFAELDETIGRAAEAGVRVLPFVYGSPSWVKRRTALPPIGTIGAQRAWAIFLRRLVQRYGPQGDLWQGHTSPRPIRRWQIWNEPNFLLFWRPRPSPRGYAHLLRISARAIRAEDRGASIVTAGVAPVEAGMRPWGFLRQMYEVPGVRGDFDAVGLHPYAPYVHWVGEQIRLVRGVMAEAGDGGKPLLLTELGVASGGRYPNAFDKGPGGQATYVRKALRLLIAKRRAWRLAGIDWFTWQDGSTPDPHCVFCEYGGLFDAAGSPKPAWWAFRRAAIGARASAVR